MALWAYQDLTYGVVEVYWHHADSATGLSGKTNKEKNYERKEEC